MLLRFFPIPEFLNMHAAGLALSDTSVRLIDFAQKDGKLLLKTHLEQPVPAGVIESGVVRDPQKLVSVLQNLKKDTDIRYVNVSLPEEKAFLFRTKIPALENMDELRSAVEFQIKEQVPLSINEVVFDYTIISKTNDDKYNIIVSVLANTVVSSYLTALHGAGFVPLSLEIESQAIASAVIAKGDDNTYIIVNVEEKQTGLSVVDGGVVQFTTTFVMDRKTMIDQIESGDESSPFKKEIEKLRMYWDTHKEERYENTKTIEKIILSGDCGDSNCFMDYLTAELNIDIVFGNVWVNAFSLDDYIPDISHKNSLRFAEAIGLALPTIERN